MAAYMIMSITTMLFAQALCMPEVNRNTIGVTIRSPAGLSYNELYVILQARNGNLKEIPNTLSPCARAILGCCKDDRINESCSESLGCGAFFFDINPCDVKFIEDALKAAKSFYQQLGDME